MQIDIKKIRIGKRGREDFGDIQALMDSMKRLGQIQPIVVRSDGDFFELIAGERRLRSAIFIGWSHIEAVTREDCSPELSLEIELEENIRRKNLEWCEEVEIKARLHELKIKQHGREWTAENTATLLNESEGKVVQDIRLARAIRSDKEVAAQLVGLPKSTAYRKLRQIEQREQRARLAKQTNLEDDLYLGDVIENLSKLKDNSVDLWITDPPFGVDQILDAKGVFKDLADHGDNLNQKESEELLAQAIPLMFGKLKPSSHFYMFFGNEFYPFLVEHFAKAGFIIDPVPLIWDKKQTTTPFRGLSYMQRYEPVLFGHKPPREKYLQKSSSNIFEVPPVNSKEKLHIFQKPIELLKIFINESSGQGDVVVDTFMGSGATIAAARLLGRRGIGFEKNEHHFRAAIEFIGGEKRC